MHRAIVVAAGSLTLACQLSSGGFGNSASNGETLADATGAPTTSSVTSTDGAPTSAGDAGGTGTTTLADSSGDDSVDDPTTEGSTSGTPTEDCSRNNGGCDPNATCDDSSGQIECTCNRGFEGDGWRCTETAAATLPPLRIELPCGTESCGSVYCIADSSVSNTVTLRGAAGSYDVTLWIRGVVEEKLYIGGNNDGFWNDGGSPNADNWNIYRLEISSPPQQYYVNSGEYVPGHATELNYEQTVTINAGAAVTITMQDSNSCAARNLDDTGTPIVIPGIPPAPDAFDGQFLQIDATSVVAAG